jgi:hypothetical protein
LHNFAFSDVALLELGFFLGAGLVWWRKRRARAESLTRNELPTVLMILTTAAICAFLRSTVIDNNDLGWRGFLVAQFGLPPPRCRKRFQSAVISTAQFANN